MSLFRHKRHLLKRKKKRRKINMGVKICYLRTTSRTGTKVFTVADLNFKVVLSRNTSSHGLKRVQHLIEIHPSFHPYIYKNMVAVLYMTSN